MAIARMYCGPRGQKIIRDEEERALKAYLCPANIWTIGYGHTGSDVHEGLEISSARAEELFKQDLVRFEIEVSSLLERPVRQSEFDALVSFAWNVGSDIDADDKAEGLGDSTLLKLVNAGGSPEQRMAAADEFPKWRRGGGRPLRGLLRRRFKEAALYLED